MTDPSIFAEKKSKVKVTHVLSLADWVRGTERPVKPWELFLSWEIEQSNPILKVISAEGLPESTFNMKSGIGIEKLEVRSCDLPPPFLTSTILRLRILGCLPSS
jgi:hypothetical protein